MEKVAIARSRGGRREGLHALRHPLRQRDGLARVGDSALRRADPGGPAADADRPGDDPLHDDAGRRGGPGGLRLPARAARRTFVQKAPAATIDTLAEALKRLLRADNPIRIIGTRHGEKLYETLLTREEMVVAEDMGGYYRVPADNRDLNYALYFSEGRHEVAAKTDYNSHNVQLLDIDGMCRFIAAARLRPASSSERAGVAVSACWRKQSHMKILVTGAKGFVGQELCVVLEQRSRQIDLYAYDLDSSPRGTDGGAVATLMSSSTWRGINRPQNGTRKFTTGNAEFTAEICPQLLALGRTPLIICFPPPSRRSTTIRTA